jgi:Zn-dependent M28 family amino/carboxypeptidase
VAAHYDTVPHSPGADDNGSGLAVMLEAARRMKDYPVRRPVRFVAFCLEEAELLGSTAYAGELKANGEELEGAIVLECVGYVAREEESQQAPAGLSVAVPVTGDFLAMIGNERSLVLVRAMEEAARQEAADLQVVSLVVPGQGELFPDVRRSDHAAFWQHGYPAVMLTDTANFRNPHYHRPTDTIETLDLGFMERVTRLLIAACLKLAGSES